MRFQCQAVTTGPWRKIDWFRDEMINCSKTNGTVTLLPAYSCSQGIQDKTSTQVFTSSAVTENKKNSRSHIGLPILSLSSEGKGRWSLMEWALSGFVTEDSVAFLLAFLNALKQDALLEGKRNSLCFVFKGDSSESLRGHLHCPLLATPGKALSTRRAPCFLMPGLRLACFGWKALGSPRILFPLQILIVYGSPHAKVLRFHPKNI